MTTRRPPGWLRGVLATADQTQPHHGLGRDGTPTTVREVLEETPIATGKDEQERVRICELHAAIIQATAQIEWHASEALRITADRKAAQAELATIMARLGLAMQEQ